MGTAVGVGVSIAIDAGMGVAVSVNMDVGGILATFVSAWLLGVGLDCIVPTPGAVAVGSGVAVGVGSGVFAAPRAMVGGATLNGSVAGTVGRVERVWGAWTGPLGVSGVDGAGCAADCGVPLQAAARRVRMGRTETTSRTLFVPNAENPPEMYTGASYSLMALMLAPNWVRARRCAVRHSWLWTHSKNWCRAKYRSASRRRCRRRWPRNWLTYHASTCHSDRYPRQRPRVVLPQMDGENPEQLLITVIVM